MSEQKINMERIEEMFAGLSGQMKLMDNKLEHIMSDNAGLREENQRLKAQLSQQGKLIESLDREMRRKNLIIKGVRDKDEENREGAKEETEKILQKIGVNINMATEIDEIKRLGKYREGRQRPILIRLTTGNGKMRILQKSKELKGTNVWIEEDYTKETQEERRRLIPHLKEARRQGFRAQLRHDKLLIDDKIYEAKELEEIELASDRMDQRKNKRTVSERSPNGGTEQENTKKITLMTKNDK